jgi:hypothetical protein
VMPVFIFIDVIIVVTFAVGLLDALTMPEV